MHMHVHGHPRNCNGEALQPVSNTMVQSTRSSRMLTLPASRENFYESFHSVSKNCEPPGLLQESLGPFGPEVSPECPGVSQGECDGVSPGPFSPRAPEWPKSVPRVSPECPGYLFDTLGTLSGHFLDTQEPRADPVGRFLEHPRFRGHTRRHFLEHSGPKGPRDHCSWSAGSQSKKARRRI